MWTLFWYFLLYSFLGFCLEVAYARLTHGPKPDRKCRLLLPLCPVYGLGAVAILILLPLLGNHLLLLIPAAALAATAVEYAAAWFYETALGVRFWDYGDLPGNLHGRVCPLFCLYWAVLTPVFLYLVHPMVRHLVARLPVWLAPAALTLFLGDTWFSFRLLRHTGSTDSLRWPLFS